MANPYAKQTWTDGVSAASAARLGVIEDGIYDAHKQPCCRTGHNANQSIANTTFTVLAFNTEVYDRDGLGTSTIHDNATNNSRLICRVAGAYSTKACIQWAANAVGIRQVNVRLNGTTTIGVETRSEVTADVAEVMTVTTDYDLAVNDYVEVVVYQSSGGALDVSLAASYSPTFCMHRVG